MSQNKELPGQMSILDHVPLPSDGTTCPDCPPPKAPRVPRAPRAGSPAKASQAKSAALSIDVLSDTVKRIRDGLIFKDNYREEFRQLAFIEKDLEQLFRNGLPYSLYSVLRGDINSLRDLIRGELLRIPRKRKFSSHAEVAECLGIDLSISHTFKKMCDKLEPDVVADIDFTTMLDSEGNSYCFVLKDGKLDLVISNPQEMVASQHLEIEARKSKDFFDGKILQSIMNLKENKKL